MKVQPLPFSKATGAVRDNYLRIVEAFRIGYLPMFFQYLGPFPDYLDFLTGQVVKSLGNRKFDGVTGEVGDAIASLMTEFEKSSEITGWLQHYRYSPQFYHFREDVKLIYRANVQLVFLFIALREAVKGWAVAAKKISPSTKPFSAHEEKQFVYEDSAETLLPVIVSHRISATTPPDHTLDNRSQQIEVNLLVEYLRLCRMDFDALVKKEKYLILRVETEKMILHTLPILPELIFSPINVVLEKTARYRDYGELLYLLSELFPQLAVQKVLFSAYLL